MIVVGQGVVEWVARVNKEIDGYGAAVGIGVAHDGEIQGGVVYHRWCGTSIAIHIASNGSKKWVTRDWIKAFFSYAFDQAKVNKIIAQIPEGNVQSLNFALKIGFAEETRIADAYYGSPIVVLKMTRDMCRWIN